MNFTDKFLNDASPSDLRNIVADLVSRMSGVEQAVVKIKHLDELTSLLGTQAAESINTTDLVASGELRSFLLTAGNQMAVGGAIIVCKDAGKLAAAALATDSTMDFGKAMTVGDWLQLQGQDADGNLNSVEVVLVGALVTGTIYNVTRDVDGSGANAWAQNTPFAVIGQEGDNRIELVAGATGTLALITQGATWDAYTVQCEMSTVDGAITAGGGSVRLDIGGITLLNAVTLNGKLFLQAAGDALYQALAVAGVTGTFQIGVESNAGGTAPQAYIRFANPTGASNLLGTNPGFELGNASGWTVTGAGATLTATAAQKHAGTYSGDLFAASGSPTVETAAANRAVVVAGSTYDFSIWLYSPSLAAVSVYATFYDTGGGGKPSTIMANSQYIGPGWTQIRKTVAAPTGATRAGVEVVTGYGVHLYLDDALINAAATSWNAVLNSDGTATTGPILASMLGGVKSAEGYLRNGKIVLSGGGSSIITLALKTLAGNDASVTDSIYCVIGGVERQITAALSVQLSTASSVFNAGSAELLGKEIDYFAYLGYNATDGVTIGFARIPWATKYGDFSTTATAETYCKVSTITNAAATDSYNVIGRFAATLTLPAGYIWTLPTYTPLNLIQRPIYETRWLNWVPQWTGCSAAPTLAGARYQLALDKMFWEYLESGVGTANATTVTISFPFKQNSGQAQYVAAVVDINAAYTMGIVTMANAGNTATLRSGTLGNPVNGQAISLDGGGMWNLV